MNAHLVSFFLAKKGVAAKIDGRISFPGREWGARRPQVGEQWLVQIAGENQQSTVHFLRAIMSPEDIAGRALDIAIREKVAHAEIVEEQAEEFMAYVREHGPWLEHGMLKWTGFDLEELGTLFPDSYYGRWWANVQER